MEPPITPGLIPFLRNKTPFEKTKEVLSSAHQSVVRDTKFKLIYMVTMGKLQQQQTGEMEGKLSKMLKSLTMALN